MRSGALSIGSPEMAVNAATPMLTDADRAAIELLIVGTESSPDQGKPLSTFVHRFLEADYLRLTLLGTVQVLYFAPLGLLFILGKTERGLLRNALGRGRGSEE